jgi:hypothetical protein
MLAATGTGALQAAFAPRRGSGSHAARRLPALASLPHDASLPAVDLAAVPAFSVRRPTRRASLAFSQQLAQAEKAAAPPLTAVLGLGQAMVRRR